MKPERVEDKSAPLCDTITALAKRDGISRSEAAHRILFSKDVSENVRLQKALESTQNTIRKEDSKQVRNIAGENFDALVDDYLCGPGLGLFRYQAEEMVKRTPEGQRLICSGTV